MKQVKHYSMQMLMTMALVFTMMMSMGMKASATSRVNIADLTAGQILEQGTVIIGDEGYLNYCLSESDANEGLYQSYDSLEEGSVTLSNQMTGEYCNGISVTSPAGLWKVWSVTETVGDLDVYLIPFVEERRGEGWHLDAQGCLHLTGSIHVSEEIPWSEFREEILTVVAEEGASVDTGEYLFYDCGNLRMADLSKLDVSKVKIMNNMFACCSNLSSLNLTGWNTSNVTDMRLMFNFCRRLYDLDLSSFDTSHVTDMSDMFDMCERLSSLDLKNFNTSNVTSMRNMFWFCLNLSSLNVSSFNTSKVVDMENMFYMCEKLTSLDVSSFDTSKVESMDGMFWGCSSLTKLDVSNFSTASIKTSGAMNDMFRNCDALTELSTNEAMLAETAEPLIIFHAAWKNKDNNQIYQTLDQLKNITGKVTLVTVIGAGDGWYIDNDGCMHITGRLRLDFDDFWNGYVNPYWFEYETLVTSIVAEEGAETWDGLALFSHFWNMTSADLSKLDTSNVDDMQSMFQGCYKLKTLNLSGFDTSHVVNMGRMFDGCSSLTALDLSSFDTSNVWDMAEMFRSCHSLETLDLSGFETCKVKYMGYMFGDCKSLTSLNISSFSLPLLQDVDAATGQDNLSLMYLFDAPRKKVTIDSALLARFGQRVFEHNPMWVNQSHDQLYLTKGQLNNLSGKVTMAAVLQLGTNWYCDGFGDLHLFGEIDNASTAAAENTPWKEYKEQIERVIADSKTVISNGTYLFTNYPNLKELTFEGDAPAFADNSFKGVTATVKYPANNATWTEVVKKQYGGKITWVTDGTAPVISSLSNNATGVQVTWGAVTGASQYRVFYKTATGAWTTFANVKGTSTTVTGLKSGTAYSFLVRCLSADGKSYTDTYDAAKSKSITYIAQPAVSSVSNTANGVQVKWNAVGGAAQYRVFYKAEGGAWTGFGNTKETSMVVTGLTAGTTYSFTVRCISADGKAYTSTYDTTGKSIVYQPADTMLAKPEITALNSNASGVQVTWGAVAGAAQYRVFYKTATGAWTTFANVKGTSTTVTGLTSGTTYTFLVRCLSEDAKAYTSDYDATKSKSITYIAQPAVSSLSNVANGVEVKWNAVGGAAQYRVFYKAGSGAWTGFNNTTGTSMVVTGLTAGTTYSFTVRCVSADGKSYTSTYDTTGKSIVYQPAAGTMLAKPEITALSSNSAGVQVTWGAVAGAAQYRVFYKTATGAWTTFGNTTGTSLTVTGLTSGTTYTFLVRCLSADGKAYTSDYDAAMSKSLTYIAQPAVSSVTNTSTGVQVKWNAVPGAAQYRVFYKPAGGAWTGYSNTTGTSMTVTGLTKGTTYSFTVRCLSADGKSYTSTYDTTGKSIKYE